MRVIPRIIASVLSALALGAGLTGCNSSPGADITGIEALAGEFPTGFTVQAGLSKILSRDDVERSGVRVVTEAELSPAHCLSMIIPAYAHPGVGTRAAGVTAIGEPGGVQVSALRLPEAVAVTPVPADCTRVVVSGAQAGIAERVPAPAIAGATTTGVKLTAAEPGAPAHYLFTAALDGRTAVVVRSSLDEAGHPPQLLTELLVKAVSAARGR